MTKTIFIISSSVALLSCEQPKSETSVSGRETTVAVASETEEAKTPETAAVVKRCLVEAPEVAPVVEEGQGECPTDPVFGGVTMERGSVRFPDAPNQPVVSVEVAKTDAQRARGLMYRRSLPSNDGMLFLPRGEPRVQSFWMRNTCISLDMMFINDDGFIAGILENVPILNDAPRRIDCPTSYVLEVNGGWSRKHGVKAGQTVMLP